MTTLTQPLREEHAELLPHVESLRMAADSVGVDSPHVVLAKAQQAYDFLWHHLIPHAQAEDVALYPMVQKAMGAARATATMSRDHVEVGTLTGELATALAKIKSGGLPADVARELRRTLYGLYALVRVHFAKEEEIYLPILDAELTPAEAEAMFEAMEAAAGRAKGKRTKPAA
jgi:iron-sulfur cluster repair protein YtfE (RIC family)